MSQPNSRRLRRRPDTDSDDESLSDLPTLQNAPTSPNGDNDDNGS